MATGLESRTDAKGRKRYRGVVYSKVTGKRNGPWGSHADAKAWRSRALGEIEAGRVTKSEPTTLREEWAAFLAGAKAGTVTDRSGKAYKPGTLRAYAIGWKRIEPELGAHRVTDIRRPDVQAMVDRWAAQGVAPGTIRNALDPLRAMYRRAHARDRVPINPTTGLDVPRAPAGRERIASKTEAVALLSALPDGDRALWATAMYAGLRRGELRALRWDDVDLAAGLIHVRRSWDDQEGEQAPKTKAATRKVPIVPPLAECLRTHQSVTGRAGSDLVFGRSASTPFARESVRRRANSAWDKAGMDGIGLHACRHTFASMMIAAGCNAKALSVVMGHASITITFDRYGHLMPGGEAEVGRLLSEYLDQ